MQVGICCTEMKDVIIMSKLMIVFQKGRTSIHKAEGGELSKEALSKLLCWGWGRAERRRHSELFLQAYWEHVRLPLKD